jgi:hypothetical protein
VTPENLDRGEQCFQGGPEPPDALQLKRCRVAASETEGKGLEIPHHENPDLTRVGALDVRALETEAASFVDLAPTFDHEMVPDIVPLPHVHVLLLNLLGIVLARST